MTWQLAVLCKQLSFASFILSWRRRLLALGGLQRMLTVTLGSISKMKQGDQPSETVYGK